MKIVIEIDEEDWKDINDIHFIREDLKFKIGKAIMKGTPLPANHGRLIDADALEYTCNVDECGMLTGCNHCQYHIITEHEIDNAPTIIEGSDSE